MFVSIRHEMVLLAEAYRKVSSGHELAFLVFAAALWHFFSLPYKIPLLWSPHETLKSFSFSQLATYVKDSALFSFLLSFSFYTKLCFYSPNTAAILWVQDFKWMLCFHKHSQCLCMTHAAVQPPLLDFSIWSSPPDWLETQTSFPDT